VQQNKRPKRKQEEIYSSFSANVLPSQQATRKKMISKLNISEIKPSSRRYPAIILIKSVKDQILNVQGLELLLMERFYLKEWI
jgi:hypothetical protein